MASTTEELPRLGRYQVINKIAAGGMAEVFLAKAVGAMGFQRLVAVKLIHANFTRDQEFVKMFIDEARIAMHLHHRNIVQVFDLDKANDTYFIAMEFVHGVNLYDLYERIASKNRWIEAPMALYLVAEVSKGLHFAHTRKGQDGRPLGIIHRDISPQNVLLSFEGEVKITDFGIATAAERLHQTAAGIVKGKYAYMAPERLREEPTDGRVDVFSAGVLLYELLVGENPFAGSSAVDTIENVLNKKIPAPSERGAPVSPQLDRIVLKALARDPRERFLTAQDLADALTEYALELTTARKDMAAGDGALAALLNELFPEKAKRPPSAAADPKSFNLPGISSGGVKVATIDPEPARGKSRNGRAPEVDPAEKNVVRDPAGGDGEDMDAPTVLRMTPMSERESIMPKVGTIKPRSKVRDEDSVTTKEIPTNDSGFTTLPPYPEGADDTSSHLLDTDKAFRGIADTPVTPVGGAELDRTAPTELPPSFPQLSKKSLAQVGSKPTDPSAAPQGMDESYAATLQSTSGLITIPEDLSAPGMPPQVIVQSAIPRSSPGPRPTQPPHLMVQPPAGVMGLPHPYGGPTGPESGPLVIPVPSGPLPAPGPAFRTTTIIAILLLIIAALVVFAAVLVVQNRERPATRGALIDLRVESNPQGAKVLIDGLEQGVTPFHGPVTANVEHLVTVSLAGYVDPVPRKIMPQEGASGIVPFDLEPARGSISVQPSPAEAAVFINDQEKGMGPVVVRDLPLGAEIIVRVEARGYKTVEQKLVLDASSRDITMPITLAKGKSAPVPRNEGRTRKLQLLAPFGTWATIYYKGRYLGTTPTSATLPVGEVQLRLVNETQKLDRTITVNVPEGGSDQITLDIK
jgi:serine/threonine protein kinase